MDYFIKKDDIGSFFEKFLQSRILLYCIIFLLVLKISISVVFVSFPKNIFFADITKTALVDMLNQARLDSRLQPLIENQKLAMAAQMKAEDMVKKQYFSHTSPQGLTPWYWFLQSGYSYKYAGENLAVGFYDSQEAFSAWLDSPSHKANILGQNYKEVGTAVLDGFGPNNAIVVVQLFGSELIKPVAVKNNTEKSNEQALIDSADKNEDGNEKVLSQTTEILIEPLKDIYNYNTLIQDIIYGLLMVITGILLFAVLFNSSIYTKKEFILRSVVIIILLLFSALLNRELIVSMIPHQIII